MDRKKEREVQLSDRKHYRYICQKIDRHEYLSGFLQYFRVDYVIYIIQCSIYLLLMNNQINSYSYIHVIIIKSRQMNKEI